VHFGRKMVRPLCVLKHFNNAKRRSHAFPLEMTPALSEPTMSVPFPNSSTSTSDLAVAYLMAAETWLTSMENAERLVEMLSVVLMRVKILSVRPIWAAFAGT